MTSLPRQREKITRTALLALISAFQQQAADLENGLSEFISGVELVVSIQPSVLTASRNAKALSNHLAAAQTLVGALGQELGR